MKLSKPGIALLLLVILVAGCHWGWIKKANGQFKLKPSYVSVNFISKYNVLTYQVVSPDLCAVLTYHTTADPEHPIPYMAGVQVQDLKAGMEQNRFIGLNGARSEVKRLAPESLNQIRECFSGSTPRKTRLDGRSIMLSPHKLKVKKSTQGEQLVVEGEIQDLAEDTCFSALLTGEKPCFRIVMDAETRLPINEYYWAAGTTVVRYLYFPKDIQAEVFRIKHLASLLEVREFLTERQIFEHLRFKLEK